MRRIAVGGVLFIALVALALPALTAAKPHHPPAKPKYPPGSVKLPVSKIKHEHGFVCGDTGRKWVSGSMVSGYFLADTRQATNYQALAKHAKGKTKADDASLAKHYAQLAKTRLATCNRAGTKPTGGGGTTSGAGGGTTGGGDGGATAAPLRFNIAGAAGLALLPSGQVADRLRGYTTSSSNLVTVNSTGQTHSALTSGSATVSKFLIAPNNEMFVLFRSPTSLDGSSNTCILAQVDTTSGVPTCVDSDLAQVSWGNGGSLTPANPAVQFDSSGAIYYEGYDSSQNLVLRKWQNGTTTNVIPPQADQSVDFLVQPSGTVFVSGQTKSTQASWLRALTPTGSGGYSTTQILGQHITWMRRFPDGNLYFGVNSNTGLGIRRYVVSSSQLDPHWWISTSQVDSGAYNPTDAACSSQGSPSPFSQHQAFCNSGNFGQYDRMLFQTTSGNVFGIATMSGGGGELTRFYAPDPNNRSQGLAPGSLAFPTTAVQGVSVGEGVINYVFLSGLDSSGNQITTMLDTSSGQETTLLPASNQVEVYHLTYFGAGNKVMFDGLRYSDNTYVVGQVDMSTLQATMTPTPGNVKFSDFQTFS